MVIYKTTNLVNGKFYIGQDSNNNSDYLGSGLRLKRSIKKYGKDNFVKEILEFCETKDELNIRERYWISELNAKEDGYNIADGGHGGNTYTEETKRRVSQIIKNRPVSDETRQKRSKSMKGKYTLQWFTDKYGETDGLILYQKRCDEVGDFHRGKTISDEHKKRISEFMKSSGNYSIEFLALQLGENKIGEKNPMWGKTGKNNNRSIPILQLDLDGNIIKEWESINLAKVTLKINGISNVLSKKRKSAGGFKWKYKGK